MKVFVIPADPTEPVREEQAPEDPEFSRWCNETVGGYLELTFVQGLGGEHRSPMNYCIWMNEDAKMQQLPPNLRATALALLLPNDFIAGDVVVTGSRPPVTAGVEIDLASFVQILDLKVQQARSGRV